MTDRTHASWTGRGASFALALLLLLLARPAVAQGLGMAELMRMMDWGRGSLILVDEFEYAPNAEGRPLELEVTGWVGGARNRVWFRLEGDQPLSGNSGESESHLFGSGGEGEVHVFYGRLISPYWDALAGVRVDGEWGSDPRARASLALGLTGLAPLRFELSPTVYLSQHGDISAQLKAEYQILVTQRLVAEPTLELNAALQEVPDLGVGSGLNDVEMAIRLRYEFTRKFAPYVGYVSTQRYGGSADFAREEGESTRESAVVVGLRLWR